MLSRNNLKEQLRKQEPKKQRFAIRKLTVGVASVLVGFTLMGMSVSADTTNNTNSSNSGKVVTNTDAGTNNGETADVNGGYSSLRYDYIYAINNC